ncbi:methyltransferase domain-containing protein [Naumannella cuiyingiana]|uniref:methyltransferase domain-containing protein n=1 Tax=Naumannella cuiyingiana TaxID=1347891 RepID=UPI0015C9B077
MSGDTCRLCRADELVSVLDLGATPPCERFLTAAELDAAEQTYPLHVRLCRRCLLLQIPALITPEDTFTEYAYFSSFSTSWVDHARRFVADATDRLGLDGDSLVVEVAANDGYLLQHVLDRKIPCLGIEPSTNVSAEAVRRGVPVVNDFLTEPLARRVREQHGPADLVVANNVWAHIPDVAGFTRALRTLVADDGRISIEVHHALNLVADAQFDTVYHEHFQYWTVLAARGALTAADLSLVDVELIPTHGGSIRFWAAPAEHAPTPSPRVGAVADAERAAGLDRVDGYAGLAPRVSRIRRDLVRLLIDAADAGLKVAGYGAPGKGQTLLNFCGIRPDLLPYLVDRNPYKHGRFTPGTRIPIRPVEQLYADRPDLVVVLPWNLREEITHQLAGIAEWGGRLVFAQPTLQIVDPATGAPTPLPTGLGASPAER